MIKLMRWQFIVLIGGIVLLPVFVFAQQTTSLSEMAALLESLQELVSNLMHQVSNRLPLVTAAPYQTDVTGDGVNNEADWEFLRVRWFTQDSVADINGDGIVNSVDFGLLNRNWNKITQ